MGRIAILTLVALLAGASAAQAATVSVTRVTGPRAEAIDQMRYRAAAGEVNRVTVAWSPGEGYVFEDATAPLTAGDGCRGGGARVTCMLTARDFAELFLGDGDDSAVVRSGDERPLLVRVLGEAGHDRLRDDGTTRRNYYRSYYGGDGDDVLSTTGGVRLFGEAGADRLIGSEHREGLEGGPGADELRGGGGDDGFDPGRDSDADLIDGGGGSDTVVYIGDFQKPIPVSVDLSVPRGAPADVLRSIENAGGTYGEDTLAGGRGPNRLSGYPGDDALRGGAGADRLEGGEGRDRLEGGSGDDYLFGDDGRDSLSGGSGDDRLDSSFYGPDRVACGPGRDTVDAYVNHTTPIPRDCERVEAGAGGLRSMDARPSFGPAGASWSLLCGKFTSAERCRPTFVLRAGGRELGRRRIAIERDSRRTLRVPLGAAGRRFAARGGRLTVEVVAKGGTARYVVSVPPAR